MNTPITPKPLLEQATILVPAQALLINNLLNKQLDLRNYSYARLFGTIARISTTAYSAASGGVAQGGPRFSIKRLFAEAFQEDGVTAGSVGGSAGSYYAKNGGKSNRDLGQYASTTASGSVTRQVSTTTALGDTSVVTKTSNTGTTSYGSKMAFLGATAPGSLSNGDLIPTFETAETKGFSGTGPWTHTLTAPLGRVHTANDYVTDAVESWEIVLPGGFIYNVAFDCLAITAGAGAVVQAIALLAPGWQSGT